MSSLLGQANDGRSRASHSLESIPDELLQRIFAFVCIDHDNVSYGEPLRHMCSTSRRWRAAAINHPRLWAKLPPIELVQNKSGDESDVQKLGRLAGRVQLYLLRSGSVPISFKIIVLEYDLAQWKTGMTVFQMLLDQCHRWEEAHFKISSPAFEHLGFVQGRVPSLTTLVVEIESQRLRSQSIPPVAACNFFADAPRLRDATWKVQLTGYSWLHPEAQRAISLPLAQLKHFHVEERADNGVCYRDLLTSPSPLLKTIDYSTRKLSISPGATPLLLPLLVKLRLHVYKFKCDILSHIGSLTLPCLDFLEIRGQLAEETTVVGGEMHEAVLALIRRSNCSLTHLSMCSMAGSPDAFNDILQRSPNLTTLDVDVCEDETLQKLVYTPDSSLPVLPQLERLIIRRSRWHRLNNGIVSTTTETLLEVIKSRSSRLDNTRTRQVLKEVVFVYMDEHDLRYNVLQSGVEMELFDLDQAGLPQESFDPPNSWWIYKLLSQWHSWVEWVSPRAMWRSEMVLRQLEKINVKKRNTHVLMRHGMPRLLLRVSEKESGCTPGDAVLRYRARAKRLLKKWKPYLIRDSQKCWWSYYGEGVLALRWNLEGNFVEDEERYRDMMGLDRVNGPAFLSQYLSLED